MMDLLAHDTNLWVGISFVAFVLIVYKFAGKFIANALDSKINEIRQEVETAERLRVEAQELLAQYQRKQRDAEQEAVDIIEKAKEQAVQMQKDAEKDLKDLMQRREEQLKERIKRLEEKAVSDIQSHAADLVVTATQDIIEKKMDSKSAKALGEETIKAVPQYLN